MTGRPGFALVLSMLLAATLSLVGLGIVAVAVREHGIANALEGRQRALARAESAALDAAHGWTTRGHGSLAIGESGSVPHPSADIAVFRVDTTLYVVRALATEGAAPGRGGATARAALLVRTFDIGAAVRHFPAAVSVEGEARLERGLVRGGGECAPLPAVMAPSVRIGSATVDGAIVEGAPESGTDPFPLELGEAASVQVGRGAVRPSPRTAGTTCLPHTANWGAPDPDHPCYGHRPLIVASGPLRVAGGSGRGILVVDGDLTLEGGFRFAGLVVVRGRLLLRDRAQIAGAIRARALTLEDGDVLGSTCDLEDLLAAPALDRAFRPATRWWIPVW